MGIVRVNVKEHYGTGEVWVEAESETEARRYVEEWCARNPPWEPVDAVNLERGDDGHFKFDVVREVRAGV